MHKKISFKNLGIISLISLIFVGCSGGSGLQGRINLQSTKTVASDLPLELDVTLSPYSADGTKSQGSEVDLISFDVCAKNQSADIGAINFGIEDLNQIFTSANDFTIKSGTSFISTYSRYDGNFTFKSPEILQKDQCKPYTFFRTGWEWQTTVDPDPVNITVVNILDSNGENLNTPNLPLAGNELNF